ncbi:MAG: hypothetical protein JSU65_09530 [Candidatus Zixiibacteriota bacterium]|nr:MAG: hypothetical protein JSU65_09530 [candidate division Zixibacteria bacterium]
MRNSTHPDKIQLIQALRTGRIPFQDHLKACENCRTLVGILKWSGAGVGPLAWEPSEAAVRRSKAIARIDQSRKPLKTLTGAIIFDSWKSQPALAVRQAPFGIERRIRFKLQQYTMEFVGIRQMTGWEFVARVYDGDAVTRQFVLQTGTRKLVVGSGDCFHWHSQQPPRRMRLLSKLLGIDLGSLQW